ncbi:tryptophan dimethylallyltransferase family protein [Streptomyces sp. NPDC051909]|uniref:tryptophan dimethylallyltransferase family protein n=1 Tax=Streptomyces sp. NPDC051909 TaxID=3154944 RepID=UPI0034180381
MDSGSRGFDPNSSYSDIGCSKLGGIARAVGFTEEAIGRILGDFSEMLDGWGDLPVGDEPRYPSDVANDGMPIEFSIAWSPTGIKLRALVEPLGSGEPTKASVARSSANLVRRLAKRHSAFIDKYLEIEDLFVSESPVSHFSVWHSVEWGPSGDAMFKLYLNPGVHGESRSPEILRQALQRLGMEESWNLLAEKFHNFSDPRDYPIILSIDLVDSAASRVKIYFRHAGMTASEIDPLGSLGEGYKTGAIRDICTYVVGDEGPYSKAPITCLTFRGDSAAVRGVTFYCPLAPNLPNDEIISGRLADFADPGLIDPQVYARVLDAASHVPLDQSAAQSWISVKNFDDPTMTLYVGPEIYSMTTKAQNSYL